MCPTRGVSNNTVVLSNLRFYRQKIIKAMLMKKICHSCFALLDVYDYRMFVTLFVFLWTMS